MRLESPAVSVKADARRPSRSKRHGHVARKLRVPANAESAAFKVIVRAKTKAAIAAAPAGPIALHVDGHLAGLALKVDGHFMFFSAGHRTDEFDRKAFASLAAIRDAVSARLDRAATPVC